MKDFLKQNLPPRVVAPLRTAAYQLEARKHLRVAKIVRQQTDNTVVQGPFEGLVFPRRSGWSVATPNLIGSYESELHPDIEALIDWGPSSVIDVGCADGYYAVGMARRLPGATVYAYDISETAQSVCAEMAKLNAVQERVVVRGECTHSDLDSLGGPDTLLILDCEGAELDLLLPDVAPALLQTTMLVEFHDFVNPMISSTIIGRFTSSHDVSIRPTLPKDPASWRATAGLSRRDARVAVDERRRTRMKPQEWAVFSPKSLRSL